MDKLKGGTRVVVAGALGETAGWLIDIKYLNARKAGATGTVINYVDGHGGEVFWVHQDDGRIAAYWYSELKSATPS